MSKMIPESPAVQLRKKHPRTISKGSEVWFGGNDGRIFCYEADSPNAIAMSMDRSYVRLPGPPYKGAVGYHGYDPVIVDVSSVDPAEVDRRLFPRNDK